MKFPSLVWIAAIAALLVTNRAHAAWSSTKPPHYVSITSANRNNLFYVGNSITFTLSNTYAASYAVRDYFGTQVDGGPISSGATSVKVAGGLNPGWYKFYLFGADQGAPWGTSVGGTTFVIFRQNPNFPQQAAKSARGSWTTSEDEVMRGVTAMGPQRMFVNDPTSVSLAVTNLNVDIGIDSSMYLPFDPIRKRALLAVFPNGTSNTPQVLSGVQQIVTQLQNKVEYWEGRNEPDGNTSGTAFVPEMKTFYNTVKAINPKLKVLGPAVVSINQTTIGWYDQFLAAGGGKYIDGLSFHAYNCMIGDLWLGRQCLSDLAALLKKYNIPNIEKWQTEQGYMAANYGAFQPRLQGRWTMLQMMIYEQNGIPKEHNHIWYDVSDGYWDEPMFWENNDTGLNPAAPLMRVWSEELFGTQYASAYDFGAVANNMYIGSLFTGPGKQVAAFMSAGNPYGVIKLSLPGATSAHCISAFGVASDYPVTNGLLALPVSELPVYVELPSGQACSVIAPVYGQNLARQTGVTITANGSGTNPLNSSYPNPTSKLNNGIYENWYYTLNNNNFPWTSNVSSFPATVEIDLPSTQSVSDVLIYAGVPWQLMSTLLDYNLQYWNGSSWVTIEHVVEPTKTVVAYTYFAWCAVDSYFSDRCLFEHHFTPVKTSKLRLSINNTTYGGAADSTITNASGQGGFQQAVIREIEIYNSGQGIAPQVLVQPARQYTTLGGSATLSVQASGSEPLTYQWMYGSTPISGANGPQFTVANVSQSNLGNYSVTVTNPEGTVTSSAASISLATPFSKWAAAYFTPAQINSGSSLLLADLENDGVNVLSKYFYNLDPTVELSASQRSALPSFTLQTQGSSTYFVITYHYNAKATDVTPTFQLAAAGSANPTWTTVQPASMTSIAADANGNPGVRVTLLATGPSQVARLAFTLN